MRELPRDPGRLEHMLIAIDNVQKFLDGKNLDDLLNDKILFYAVVKNIEIVGEAANNLTKELMEQHPEVNWKDVIGMRHVLVHDYYNILPERVLHVIENDLPPLKAQIEQYLSEMK